MTSGISKSEVARLPAVLTDDVPRAVRVQSQGRLLGRSHCVETGAAIEESPGWRPGGFFSWLVGGGSGHGYKHGIMLGDYVANRVLGQDKSPELAATFKLKDATF